MDIVYGILKEDEVLKKVPMDAYEQRLKTIV